ncbi:MAG: hypothetical protein ACJAUD_002406, partial [Crocinitomicaceae bacterium]
MEQSTGFFLDYLDSKAINRNIAIYKCSDGINKNRKLHRGSGRS